MAGLFYAVREASLALMSAGLVFRESADTEMVRDPYLGRAVQCVEIAQSPSRESNPLLSIDRTARSRSLDSDAKSWVTVGNGGPGGIRTHDSRIKSPEL